MGITDESFVFLFFSEAFSYPFGLMWNIVMGEHDRTKDEGSEIKLKVEKVIIHEKFKEYHNDLG